MTGVVYARRKRVDPAVVERVAAGKSLWEMHDLDAAYRRLGVIEHQTDWDEQHP